MYQWSDGSSVDYTNWAANEPDNAGRQKCVELCYDSPYTAYNNHFANCECWVNMRNYVCKKPATIVNLN